MNKIEAEQKSAEMVAALGPDFWTVSHNAFDGEYSPLAVSNDSAVYVSWEEVENEMGYVAHANITGYNCGRFGATPVEAVENLLTDMRRMGQHLLDSANQVSYIH